MTLLTDGVHLVSDFSLDELRTFANQVGISRRYFRGSRKGHPHYDVVGSLNYRRVRAGRAALVSTRELVQRMVRQ